MSVIKNVKEDVSTYDTEDIIVNNTKNKKVVSKTKPPCKTCKEIRDRVKSLLKWTRV